MKLFITVLDPPTFNRTINITKNSATLVWELRKNTNNCTVDKVICFCKAIKTEGSGYDIQSNNMTFNVSKDDQSNLENFTVVMENLSAYTHYECSAKTIGEGGESKWSNNTTFLTAEDRPSCPVNFRYSGSIENDRRVFKWELPHYIPGKLLSYNLQFTWEPLYKVPSYCFNDNRNCFKDIDPAINDFIYTSEETYAEYKVQISAKTNAGLGDISVVSFTSKSIGSKNKKLITVFLTQKKTENAK